MTNRLEPAAVARVVGWKQRSAPEPSSASKPSGRATVGPPRTLVTRSSWMSQSTNSWRNKRRKEAADFIETDNADGDLGYCDDGGEEDWTKATHSLLSDDESDGEGFSLRRKKVEKKVKENSSKPNKSSAELSAAAAIIGKQRLSSMFTSSSFNKKSKETDKVKCESIVDDVIKQFAPDESYRKRHRRDQISHLVASRGSVVVPIVVCSDQSENRLVTNRDCDGFTEENLVLEEEKEKSDGIVTEFGDSVKESVIEEKVEVDVEMKVEPVEKKEEVVQKLNAKISKEEDTAT